MNILFVISFNLCFECDVHFGVLILLGYYKYTSELGRKKQSDVMRALQRLRAFEYRHQPSIVRVTHPTCPDKAHRLGYKAKQVTTSCSSSLTFIHYNNSSTCYWYLLFL